MFFIFSIEKAFISSFLFFSVEKKIKVEIFEYSNELNDIFVAHLVSTKVFVEISSEFTKYILWATIIYELWGRFGVIGLFWYTCGYYRVQCWIGIWQGQVLSVDRLVHLPTSFSSIPFYLSKFFIFFSSFISIVFHYLDIIIRISDSAICKEWSIH